MTSWQFYALVDAGMKHYPDQRRGQVMFNTAWDFITVNLNKIMGTDKDPFYNDSNIDRFIAYVTENKGFSDV
jgi:hypothetical protein